MPFFLIIGFSGVIPAGTPYVQMIPFKREDWASEIVIENPNKINEKNRLYRAKKKAEQESKPSHIPPPAHQPNSP
jgi:hypothetical protein